MKQESLQNRILKYLSHKRDWINGGEIERLAMNNGYKGSTAARALWYLVEKELVVSETRKGVRVASAWFKIKN